MPKLSRKQFIGGLALGGAAIVAGRYALRHKEPPFPPRRPIREIIGLDPSLASPPPNILLINCDDLGYGDLGVYGSSAVRTPRIDALAAAGIRFTNFYACDSVCTPSRAGLLTGRYPKRMRLDFPLPSTNATLTYKIIYQLGFLANSAGLIDMDSEEGAGGLDAFEVTIAEALQLRGYRTALVGKWHLGDFTTAPEYHPLNHGFMSFVGVPHSNDMTPFPLYRDRDVVEADVADRTKLTALYTDEAIRVIRAGKDRPFFLYLAHTYPHRPFTASSQFMNHSAGGLYGDAVEEIDWNVGRLLDVLREERLDRNTLILFTSDNGPWYDGSPASLRGRKGQSFEGGFRVPMIMRWDGVIPRGTVSDAAAMNIDVFPTLMSVAGITLPSDRVIDGASLADGLRHPGAPEPNPSRVFYYYHSGTLESMRDGDWKFIRNINHYVWPMPVNEKFGSLSRQTKGPLPMLFNLSTDPGEAYNLASRYPDRVNAMTATMARWEEQMRTNRLGLLRGV